MKPLILTLAAIALVVTIVLGNHLTWIGAGAVLGIWLIVRCSIPRAGKSDLALTRRAIVWLMCFYTMIGIIILGVILVNYHWLDVIALLGTMVLVAVLVDRMPIQRQLAQEDPDEHIKA